MPAAGVLSELRRMRENDLQPHRATAYHYESGDPTLRGLMAESMATALGTNGLDPTAFPSVAEVENDLVAATSQVHGGDERTVGTVTSGGTESCMLAVLGARERWRSRHPGASEQPQLVLPVSAHPAFRKGAWLAGLDVVDVPVRPGTLEVDVAQMVAAIGPRAALVVVSAPEYAHGRVDPVVEVAAAAAARGVLCHLDMCIGGWVLPFIRAAEGLEPVGLSVPGVTSLSADLHKYAYGPKGASVLLHAESSLRSWHWYADAAWPGYPFVNNTLLSSRSTAPAAGAWAVLHALGEDGLRALALRQREATLQLAAAVATIPGLCVPAQPDSTLLAIADTGEPAAPDIRVVVDEMGLMGWPLQVQPARFGAPTTAHVTMTGAVAAQLDELIGALTEAVQRAADQDRPVADPALVAAAGSVDPSQLDDAGVEGLLRLAGFTADAGGGVSLPERRAQVNALLEAVPAELVERLLVGVLGKVYTPRGAATAD